MTCQECELLLGNFEDAREHLAECPECRALAAELRLNSVAMGQMRERPVMRWALASAAMIAMAIGAWRIQPLPAGHGPAPQLAKVEAPVTVARRHAPLAKKQPKFEPLKVKLLTSDPDVVIYWIVDRKEGTE